MSLPQFTTTTKLSENTNTTVLAVIRAYNSLITNLQQIFSSLLKKTQLDSIVLTNIQLSAGINVIPHTLGRTLSGWSLVRQRGIAPLVYDEQDSTTYNTSTYLVLNSSAAVIVDVLVF